MFYSHTFLARKGQLGTVWCAAHLQHNLKKTHYINTNVPSTVAIHSCTSLERFDLDSLELVDYYKDWGEDSHLKRKREITLEDQIPTGQDPLIVISFNEHNLRAPSSLQDNSGTGPVPMEEDVPPTVEEDTSAGFEDIYPNNNQLGDDDRNVRSSSLQESIEKMRNARRDSPSNEPPTLSNRAEPDEFMEEQINKEMSAPVIEEVVLPGARSSSPRNHEEELPSFGQGMWILQYLLVDHSLPEMEIRRSPTVARARRKRKQPFDESTALSNEHMRNMLNDMRDIRRAKRNCPCSCLAIWKLQNRLRLKKDGIFIKPFTTGTCADLHDIYKEDAVSSKLEPVITERIDRDTSFDQEIMHNNEGASLERQMPPPNEGSYFTSEKSNLGFLPEGLETTDGVGISPPSGKDMGASSGSHDTPGSVFSHKNQGTPQAQALTSRARAVAQYLKRQSSTTPTSGNSDDSPGDLSLFKILEGKSRKVSARMFYETLVLKNCGLLDVNQVNAYDDITLKLTPKFSKGQISY